MRPARRPALVLCLLALATLALSPAGAQTITLKIASIAPEKSPYGDALHRMASEWARISGGRVKLVFYFGGVAGEEFDIVRKMRLGQLQGGMLSQMGLSFLDRRTNILTAPALIQNDDELEAVLRGLTPDFDKMLTDKGVVPVAYSRAGWLRFFSKSDQIRTPAQMAVRKLGISGTEKDFFEGFQRMGFNVVPVEVSDSLSGLNSGLIDSTFSPPLVVAPYQWFAIEKNMLDLPISPFIGAIVVDAKAWARVPADKRQAMIDVARNLSGTVLDGAIDGLENQAMDLMVKYGLKKIVPTADEVKLWREQLQKSLPYLEEWALVTSPPSRR